MEIQKIFSNIEDPEETLYSVLMSEEELSLFSKVKEEKRKENEYLSLRKNLLEVSHGKPTNKLNDRWSEEDEDLMDFYKTGKIRTRKSVKDAAIVGSLSALPGGIIGYRSWGSKKGAALGASLGTAIGSGLSYGIDKFGEKHAKKKLAEDPHYFDVVKEYLKYKHGKSTQKRVEKKIREEYKRDNNKN